MKEEIESKSVSELIKELKEIKDKFGDVSLNFCKCKMLSLAEEGQIGLKQAYLAGLKEGAERYKTKWHKVSDGDLPKGEDAVLIYWKAGDIRCFSVVEPYKVTEDKHIIAWCELPKYTEE